MQVELNNETYNYMKVFGAKITEDVVRGLSTTYKFSFEEAMKGLKVEVKEKKEKKETKKKGSSIPLPFCGVISESDCQAIRLNHGLYTQCTNDIVETINGRGVCSTCEKQIQKNTNKLPTYGYITERVEKGATFRDPKGKSPVRREVTIGLPQFRKIPTRNGRCFDKEDRNGKEDDRDGRESSQRKGGDGKIL